MYLIIIMKGAHTHTHTCDQILECHILLAKENKKERETHI